MCSIIAIVFNTLKIFLFSSYRVLLISTFVSSWCLFLLTIYFLIQVIFAYLSACLKFYHILTIVTNVENLASVFFLLKMLIFILAGRS